jgi:uncharacterized alpha-E superfamily protein
VLACVRLVRENARTVREHLPAEAWEGINELHLALRGAAQLDSGQENLDSALAAVRAAGRQLEGQLEAALLRDEGWYFAQLGRQMERADQTSRLVDVQHALLEGRGEEMGHELRWEAVLKSASALTMYRRRHGATRGPQVAEFLLLDPAFPRSLAFTLFKAETALMAINGTPPGQFRNRAEKACSTSSSTNAPAPVVISTALPTLVNPAKLAALFVVKSIALPFAPVPAATFAT